MEECEGNESLSEVESRKRSLQERPEEEGTGKDSDPPAETSSSRRSRKKTFCASVILRKSRRGRETEAKVRGKKTGKTEYERSGLPASCTALPACQPPELPPADPLLLQKIESDCGGLLTIGSSLREVRFYGESAVVLLSWDDPRDVAFQSGFRRLVVDDKTVLALSFNAPYTPLTLGDGKVVNIRLGVPTRDLYVDGRPYSAIFGGPPIHIAVDNASHSLQLGGPVPHLTIGDFKRTDLIAGKISLIVDDDINTPIPIYLDTKPQQFFIDSTPFVLRFERTLQSAFINGLMLPVRFGDVPVPVKALGQIHYLRFSRLPSGVYQGLVNLADSDVGYNFVTNLQILQPPATQDTYNYHYHYHYHCPPLDIDYRLNSYKGSLSTKPEVPKTAEYTVLMDETLIPSTSTVDIQELYRKLVQSGIVKTETPNEEQEIRQEKKPSVTSSTEITLKKRETLKSRNTKAVSLLYDGVQCLSCGLRFVNNEEEYDSHIESHMSDQPNPSKWWRHCSNFLGRSNNKEMVDWFQQNGLYKKNVKKVSIIPGILEDEDVGSSMCICSEEDFQTLPLEKQTDCSAVEAALEAENELYDDVVMNSNMSGDVSEDVINVVDVDDEPIEVESDEELYGGISVREMPDEDTSDVDILEITELEQQYETIELSDYELEEGEIMEGPEEREDEGLFCLSRVKEEKTETWGTSVGATLDGNMDYRSAEMVRPRKIKVNISSVNAAATLTPNTAADCPPLDDVSDYEEDAAPCPEAVKPRVAAANITVHIARASGKEKSALCSLM